jgi:hypothetical protein
VSQPALDVADQRVGKAEDAGGNARGIEKLAGQDEEGDREQRKAVDARRHPLHDDGERNDRMQDEIEQCASGEGESDRHFEQNQHTERRKHHENGEIHARSFRSVYLRQVARS